MQKIIISLVLCALLVLVFLLYKGNSATTPTIRQVERVASQCQYPGGDNATCDNSEPACISLRKDGSPCQAVQLQVMGAHEQLPVTGK